MIEDQETTVYDLVNWISWQCASAGKKGEQSFMEVKLWAEFAHTVEMLLQLKNKDK